MRKQKVFLAASLVLLLLGMTAWQCDRMADTLTPYPTYTPVPSLVPDEENILVKAHVLTDSPPPGTGYARREGEPKEVGVYEFYLKNPEVPGSGAFEKVDSIPLEKIDSTELYGEKRVPRISGPSCIGYPSTNIIDGKACVQIDQSKDEVEITVHYWKTSLMILR